MAAGKPSSKGKAWFCTTGLPSDIVIEVDEMSFHLHKFPLMSKSRKLHHMITEQENNPTIASKQVKETETEIEEEEEEEKEVTCLVILPDFPGGSETFEMVAKFCYGVKMELSSSNVAPLRCSGEYLEMTEEYAEDNLISKTQRFFSQSVFKSLKDSTKALKSCENVVSFAESLGIIQRCIDSIALRASSADPALFGWPVSEGERSASSQNLCNGIETNLRRKNVKHSESQSWFEDLSELSLPLFNRLIAEMKSRDLSGGIIESCLMFYAMKHIPGISRSSRKQSRSSTIPSESEQRELLETVIANLPLEKSSSATSTTATRFLFGLLRAANILNASESCRSALEMKIGSQLDQATLDDLLIPSYSYLSETLYDVNCVERIFGYFLVGLQGEENQENTTSRSPPLTLVGKLIDGYLSEIASDANLNPDKFYNLAISLPDQARLFDDGLYRAVDIYVKAHPWISEAEREKICGIMDCQKLTLEACTHVAQNERLPLRAVVQVLFLEQLQLRLAIAGTLLEGEMAPQEAGRAAGIRLEETETQTEEEGERVGGGAEVRSSAKWRAALRENQVLRLDMDSMRTQVHQLERECTTMKKVIEKIDKKGPVGSWKASLTRKFGCKFKTQVCDSHQQTVVDARKGGQQHHPL